MYIRHITLLSLVDLPGEQVELIRPCWANVYHVHALMLVSVLPVLDLTLA